MANTTSKGTAPRISKTTQNKTPPQTSVAPARKARAKTTAKSHEITPDLRQQMIAEAAYLRAEQRNFSPGDPQDDWLAAEREIDMLLVERALQVQQ